MLSEQSKEQFKYQIPLPGWGEEGQEALANSHAVVVGLGGLGSHSALSLARAGVGRISLIDPDRVELSNLPRQHFTYYQAGKKACKVLEIASEIRRISPNISLYLMDDYLSENNIMMFADADIFIDGLDNWSTRYLINDFCKEHGIPWVYAGVSGVRGNIFSILPKTKDGQTPWEKAGISTQDLREFLGDEPEQREKDKNKPTPGVLSPLLPIIANLQVIEALKILVHNYEAVCKEFLTFNGWDMKWRTIDVSG
jgi:molybdopterin-synthase adenylyltransferase